MKKPGQTRYILSNKELEILNLMVYDDLGVTEVAKVLCISMGTINWHLESIRQKYETPTTYQAVLKYIKEKHEIESDAKTENAVLY